MRQTQPIRPTLVASLAWLLLFAVLTHPAAAQPAFAVASIRPSAAPVPFERDGATTTTPVTLRMRDVTLGTCIQWAYGVQRSQIAGPEFIEKEHFDIEAKADGPVGAAQMKLMLRTLLAERFQLKFHREPRELKGFALIVIKPGKKLHPTAHPGDTVRENSDIGTVAKSITMADFASFLGSSLNTPVVDQTNLPGQYDLEIDFTAYLPQDQTTERPDVPSTLNAALQGELGLKLSPGKQRVEVLVIDQAAMPSPN